MKSQQDKGFLKEVFVGTVSNIFCQIFFLCITNVGAIFVAANTLIKEVKGQEIGVVWWMIFSLFLFLSVSNLVVLVVYLIRKSNKPSFPTIKSDVCYENIKTELYFEDREHIRCIRDVSFKVLCKKMSYIRKQFTWTGDGYKGTFLDESTKLRRYKLDDAVRRLPPQIYDIEFDTEKKKGDHVNYKIYSEVEDVSHVMQPFLSQQILQKTKKLTLLLTVPQGMVKNVNLVVYADSVRRNKISKPEMIEGKNFANMEAYEITIKNPNLLHVYRVEWNWV